MLLTITLEIQSRGKSIDIQADSENKIVDTLMILEGKGFLQLEDIENHREIYSIRNRERIDIDRSYAEGNIFTGDILRI